MACRDWCTGGALTDKDNPESSLITWEITVAQFSQWFVNEVLSVFDRSSAPEIPAQFYVRLHSSTSSATEAGTEVTDANYAAQAVSFERVTDLQRWSTAKLTFPAADAQMTVASLSIWSAATAGNYYGYGNLSEAITVIAGDAIEIPANKVILNLA